MSTSNHHPEQTQTRIQNSVKSPKRYDLVESFDALALSGEKRPRDELGARHALNLNGVISKQHHHKVPFKDGGFVGGFSPGLKAVNETTITNNTNNTTGDSTHDATPTKVLRSTPYRRSNSSNNESSRPWKFPIPTPSPGPLPRPPPLISPEQRSLTMKYALGSPLGTGLIQPGDHSSLLYKSSSRPQLDSALPQAEPSPAAAAAAAPSKPSLDVTPKRRRAASSPPSPSTTPSKGGTVQCSGVTKAGKRCARQVKAAPALSDILPDAQIERFCHQHSKELLQVSGFYSHMVANEYITFSDWIPDYLQPDTQVALRVEMEKPRSHADVSGYIYTFEIRDPKISKVHFKVGRTVNLVKRIDQWGKRCASKEQVLRGWWPGTVEDDDDDDQAINGSLMKGRVRAGDKGPLCHRLERLVHLELADLAVNAPYLEPGFPKTTKKKDAGGGSTSSSKKPLTSPAGKKLLDKPCPDCGSTHKEIFSLTRAGSGRYKGKEWDLLVKPVIEKWGAFVSAYV